MRKELKTRIVHSSILALVLMGVPACSLKNRVMENEQYASIEGTPEGLNAISDMLTGIIVQSKREDAKGDDAHYELRRSQERYRGLSYYMNRKGKVSKNNSNTGQ